MRTCKMKIILSTLISLTLLHVTLSVNAQSQITQQQHIVKQVGTHLLTDGRSFYTITTNHNHYFILSTDEFIAQGFEFAVGSAELLTEESSAWGEVRHSFKSDKLYLIKDIEIISVPVEMNGKCFRSYKKTKEILPCDDKKAR